MSTMQGIAEQAERERQLSKLGLLNIRDVAGMLRVSTRAVWAMMACGKFGPDVIRLGRAVRFKTGEVSAWCEAGCPNRDEWIIKRETADVRSLRSPER